MVIKYCIATTKSSPRDFMGEPSRVLVISNAHKSELPYQTSSTYPLRDNVKLFLKTI